MRTIIAGSRTVTDYSLLNNLLWVPTVIISGGARGADALGERYAEEHNIPLEIYPAKWSLYGKEAGYLRNAKMASKAEALIALWDGESRGTKHMIGLARARGLRIDIRRLLTGD